MWEPEALKEVNISQLEGGGWNLNETRHMHS